MSLRRSTIDLNCDLGEGAAHDAALMPLVTSANVCCGLHAGSSELMAATVQLAMQHGVAVGAHPGHADRDHFGRREMAITPSECAAVIESQIAAVVVAAGAALHHVKLHGGLYHQVGREAPLAEAVATMLADRWPQLVIYAQAGSQFVSIARSRGLAVAEEAFIDRRYLADGGLAPRSAAGATIDDPAEAAAQAVREFLDPRLGLRIVSFGAAAETGAATLPAQEAAISLTPRGGGDDLELRIRSADDASAESLAANFKPRGGDIAVDALASSLFKVSPEQLRDRSLGYVDLDTVDRIRLESEGKAVTLQREGEDWVGDTDGAKRSGEEMAKLVSAFNDAEVGGFRTTETAEMTGLTAPRQKIVFYAWLTENTAEDAAGGHVIAGADFGYTAADGNVYARSTTGDETVTIPAGLSEAVRSAVFPAAEVSSPR